MACDVTAIQPEQLYAMLFDDSDPAYQALYELSLGTPHWHFPVPQAIFDEFREFEEFNDCRLITTLARKLAASSPQLIQRALIKNLETLLLASELHSLVGRQYLPKKESTHAKCFGLLAQRAANMACLLIPFLHFEHGLKPLDIAAECRRLLDADADSDDKRDAAQIIQTFIWSAQTVYNSFEFTLYGPNSEVANEDSGLNSPSTGCPSAPGSFSDQDHRDLWVIARELSKGERYFKNKELTEEFQKRFPSKALTRTRVSDWLTAMHKNWNEASKPLLRRGANNRDMTYSVNPKLKLKSTM